MTAIDTTTLTPDQIAFAEKLAARKAAREATAKPRRARKTTLELARDQFDRQLAERPTGIHRNPDAKAGRQWEAYRDGRLLGGADSNFGAQAILDGVTYDELSRRNAQGMNAPAGDVVVTAIVETPAGDVAVREVVLADAVSEEGNTMGETAKDCERCGATETTRRMVLMVIESPHGRARVTAGYDLCGACGAQADQDEPIQNMTAWLAAGKHTCPHCEAVLVDCAECDGLKCAACDPVCRATLSEEGTMDAQTYEREVGAVEQAGTGEYAAGWDVIETNAAGEESAVAVNVAEARAQDLAIIYSSHEIEGVTFESRPKPLAVCPCGVTYTTHAIPGCECAAEAAYTGVTLEAALANAKAPLPKCAKGGCIEGATVTCSYCGEVYCADCGPTGCHECGGEAMVALLDEAETPPPAPSASEPVACGGCNARPDETCVCPLLDEPSSDPAARYRPFSNGSQFADWESSNCNRCTKSALGDDGYALNCPLLNALFMADMDDGTIDAATARGIGYLDADGQETGRYVWPCAEVEWTEEWKAACIARETETPPPAPERSPSDPDGWDGRGVVVVEPARSASEPAAIKGKQRGWYKFADLRWWHWFNDGMSACGDYLLAPDVRPQAIRGEGDVCPGCFLPFTPGPADTADALAEIEAAAGVVDIEPPPDEMTLQYGALLRLFDAWFETLGAEDVAEVRAEFIGAMLRVEQMARGKAISAYPAVVGRAA